MTAPSLRAIFPTAFALFHLLLVAGAAFAETKPDAVWGQPNHGMTSCIRADKLDFKAGEKIRITYGLRNVSDKAIRVWHSGFWPNHQIRVCDAEGRFAPLTASGKERLAAFSPGGSRNKNFPVELAPGGEDFTEGGYDIAEFYALAAPGPYSVQYLYEEYQGGWEGQLWSNVLVIHISK